MVHTLLVSIGAATAAAAYLVAKHRMPSVTVLGVWALAEAVMALGALTFGAPEIAAAHVFVCLLVVVIAEDAPAGQRAGRRSARWPMAGAVIALVVGCVLAAAGWAYLQGARGICPTEDSVSCVWIGPLQGNHRGAVVVNGPEER